MYAYKVLLSFLFVFDIIAWSESNVLTITCDTQFSEVTNLISLLVCPPACATSTTTLCGTETFSKGSICLAAIHSGIIAGSGGLVTVLKTTGQILYQGSSKNGVVSSTCENSSVSYTFAGSFVKNTYLSRLEPLACSSTTNTINDCLSNRCLNNGTCHDTYNGFYCTCLPGFTGLTCESAVPVLPTSCAQVKTKTNGSYLISPMPGLVAPFNVSCQFEGSKGKTLFSHDTEMETQVTSDLALGYKRNITYMLSSRQIQAVIKASSHCRQYLKYRCKGSVLHQGLIVWGSYAGPDLKLKNHWAGTNTSFSCVCGDTGTCIDVTYKCNCDQNKNAVSTYDDGYVTMKSDLPVSRVEFGDATGVGESAFYTVGKLECW